MCLAEANKRCRHVVRASVCVLRGFAFSFNDVRVMMISSYTLVIRPPGVIVLPFSVRSIHHVSTNAALSTSNTHEQPHRTEGPGQNVELNTTTASPVRFPGRAFTFRGPAEEFRRSYIHIIRALALTCMCVGQLCFSVLYFQNDKPVDTKRTLWACALAV